jgi:tetratricopeptide (TPR) repeat protein
LQAVSNFYNCETAIKSTFRSSIREVNMRKCLWTVPLLAIALLPTASLAVEYSAKIYKDAQGSRFGLSPTLARAMEKEILRLSALNKIQSATLFAVADRLGARHQHSSFADLLLLVDNSAQKAKKLRAEITDLKAQIATLKESSLTNPANSAIAQAQLAFDEGRLDDAEIAFSRLEPLRMGQSIESIEAWVKVVGAQIKIANLMGDSDGAIQIAERAALANRERNDKIQWRLELNVGAALLIKAIELQNFSSLSKPVDHLRNIVLPLAPRATRPFDWAETLNLLGNALNARADWMDHLAGMREAEGVYNEALQVRTRASAPEKWAETQNNLGTVYQGIGEYLSLGEGDAFGEGGGKIGYYRKALVAFSEALKETDPVKSYEEWLPTKLNVAMTQASLAAMESDRKLAEDAKKAFEVALMTIDQNVRPGLWAQTSAALAFNEAWLAFFSRDLALLNQAERRAKSALVRAGAAHSQNISAYVQEALKMIQDARLRWN